MMKPSYDLEIKTCWVRASSNYTFTSLCILFLNSIMLLFSGENLYVRQDGTLSYYFSEENLHRLCINAGLIKIENEYILRQYANRKESTARYRVWIHAKYEKPL